MPILIALGCSSSANDAADAMRATIDGAADDGAGADATSPDAALSDAAPTDGGLQEANLAWYRLDESTGTSVADSSGKSNDGTIVGGITLAQAGVVGTAMAFDGSSGTIGMGTPTDFDSLPAVTVEAWVKLDSYTQFGNGVVMQVVGNSDADFGLLVDDSPAGSVWWISAAADGGNFSYRSIQTTGSMVPLNSWVHIAGMYEVASNTRRIFVNGVEVAPDPELSFGGQTAAAMDGAGPLQIGSYDWDGTNSFFTDGLIDDVKMWDHLRTQEQVCEDAGGIPGSGPSCDLSSLNL